ncbi:hypothetical protein AAFC00_002293 [Neodothiora populina]|uniref:FAD dependent oxidoreductase domain-containing protein n=1 Tax=Neodothiora populina TaxID=2781224 RepID=A0ABR3PH65_9PEZI
MDKSARIVIVGAGVSGLTSALHLSRRGYKDIHIFDKQEYDRNGYAVSQGCDAASADENKILRASYGKEELYQDMAFGAMEEWDKWNHEIRNADDLPATLSKEDKLWENCGFLRIGNKCDEFEEETQKHFPEHIKHTQYRITDPQRVKDALVHGIPAAKIDPFRRAERRLETDGILDTTAGFLLASKACAYALHLCVKAGVHAHLGPKVGELTSLIKSEDTVTGIRTADGLTHHADLVIIAAGGWTPSLVPQADRLLETTAGSIVLVKLPEDRRDLWDKYSPEKFPVWSWKIQNYGPAGTGTSTGGLYSFPRTADGLIKFGFRGVKYTNYAWPPTRDPEGRLISYPKTDLDVVPQRALEACRAFCRENMPDLLELDMQRGRLCWYTDSVDNSFLIDYVPGAKGLMVASGGSGHGFKFLPVLGEHVVDVVERRQTAYTKKFAWRDVPEGKKNGLEEGPEGRRTLDKQKLVGRREWKL